MNQRSLVLFLPSLILVGFASHNIIKKRRHAAEAEAAAYQLALAQPIPTAVQAITPTISSRSPASFGTATPANVSSLPTERLSLAFAQELLQQQLKDKKLPLSEALSTQRYEEKLRNLTAKDGYPDQPELFLRHLCEDGTTGACPLLWNLWQQPGSAEESVTRKIAVLLLSCVETGGLCQQAIEAHRGTIFEESLVQLTKSYCQGGIKSACEETTPASNEIQNSTTENANAQPTNAGSRMPASAGSRMPASAMPVGAPTPVAIQPVNDLRTASLRRCEDESAADCSNIATLEARDANLDAANDYAEYSCAAGFAEGCLQLAKIQYQKTKSLGATKEGLQRLCNQPQNAAANMALCKDLASGATLNARFFSNHREVRTAEGSRLAENLAQYFLTNW